MTTEKKAVCKDERGFWRGTGGRGNRWPVVTWIVVAAMVTNTMPQAAQAAGFKLKPTFEPADCQRGPMGDCTLVDVTTPPEKTAICFGYSGRNTYTNWKFRTHPYMLQKAGNRSARRGLEIVPREGKIRYGNECKRFKKKNLLVEGEYVTSRAFPLTTTGSDLCVKQPLLNFHRNDRDPKLSRLLQEPGRNAQIYGDDFSMAYHPASIFYAGDYDVPSVRGASIRKTVSAFVRLVEEQCGAAPDSIRLRGQLSLLPAFNKRSKAKSRYETTTIYEGMAYPYEREFSPGLNRSAMKIVHDDAEMAKVFAEWATAKIAEMTERQHQAKLRRLEKRRQAEQGALLVFYAMAAMFLSSPCNDPELSEKDKPEECTSYW
ncbi:MAG: hypothetical protein AB8G17_18220 [Gammaproteobacteria bacterium]